MSLLRDYIAKSPSTQAGIKAYMVEMTTRYAAKPVETGKKSVKCLWFFEFTRASEWQAVQLTIRELAKLPPEEVREYFLVKSRLTFVTYHVLTDGQTAKLMWTDLLRKKFLPYAVFGVITFGSILLFLGGNVLIVLIVIGLKGIYLKPGEGHPMIMVWALLICGLLFAISLKLQLFLRKAGRPPGIDDFDDQRIKLYSIKTE